MMSFHVIDCTLSMISEPNTSICLFAILYTEKFSLIFDILVDSDWSKIQASDNKIKTGKK